MDNVVKKQLVFKLRQRDFPVEGQERRAGGSKPESDSALDNSRIVTVGASPALPVAQIPHLAMGSAGTWRLRLPRSENPGAPHV